MNYSKRMSVSNYTILRNIFTKYVMGIPFVRRIIGPTLMCMIFARYLEVKLGEIIQRVSSHINIPFSKGCSTLVWRYFLITTVSCLLIELQGFIFTGPIQRAYRAASRDAFAYTIGLEHQNFKKLGLGEVHATIERKSSAVSEILDVLVLNFFPVAFVLSFASYQVYQIIGLVPAIILNVTLLLYAFVTIRIATWRNEIRKRMNLAVNETSNLLYDSLSNYECVVAFNNEQLEVDRYDRSLKNVEAHAKRLWRTFYFLNFLQRLIFGLQTGGVIFFGVNGYLMQRMTTDQFVFYLSVSRILAANLDKLGFMYARFTQAMTNARMTYTVPEPPKKEHAIMSFRREIEYRNVGCSYNGHRVLDNVSFLIRAGEKVAFIGHNGVGKSTLLKLLLKFGSYSGSITIDGNELSLVSQKSMRDLIAYVPQDGLMINDTVKFNLAYGNSLVGDYQIISTCRRMGVHDSIMRLEKGYMTVVGTRGSQLSGGERQKICLMRALIKDSDIIVMDEPTANIDVEAEAKLITNLFRNYAEKTVLMIVHNHDLLPLFDRVLKLTSDGVEEIIVKPENSNKL